MVEGSHTFAQAGTYTVRTSVVAHVLGQADQTIDTTATVTVEPESITNDAPLSILGAAGFPVADRLATFESNFTTDPSTWTATIDWGDGSTPTTGVVTPQQFAYLMADSVAGGAASSIVTSAFVMCGPGDLHPAVGGGARGRHGRPRLRPGGPFHRDDHGRRRPGPDRDLDGDRRRGASPIVLSGQENTVVADPTGAIVPSRADPGQGLRLRDQRAESRQRLRLPRHHQLGRWLGPDRRRPRPAPELR